MEFYHKDIAKVILEKLPKKEMYIIHEHNYCWNVILI